MIDGRHGYERLLMGHFLENHQPGNFSLLPPPTALEPESFKPHHQKPPRATPQQPRSVVPAAPRRRLSNQSPPPTGVLLRGCTRVRARAGAAGKARRPPPPPFIALPFSSTSCKLLLWAKRRRAMPECTPHTASFRAFRASRSHT
mmetsp:Transcript_49241/g.82265  ORF Transcript_49241/g.82265 Transcript_49241/m.82265 type:complete len:145 (+) Transcript_49241:597-1031(+)